VDGVLPQDDEDSDKKKRLHIQHFGGVQANVCSHGKYHYIAPVQFGSIDPN
jgi:hypothetical protein